MNLNANRRGLRPLCDVVSDWMDDIEANHQEKGIPLPGPMKKGFVGMREKIKATQKKKAA
ncbi:hypothetical protein [Serratia sp. MF2]|uniref:hypothetical protein n=1 Tax=Serratia sp. MF2 TaxID=3059173 RepID=UPI0027EE0275|nr:hypothetical protein [Serratia sp. MF2]MDQ7101921.1 hypothetical protein [Serratia sp. MF2]